MNVGDSLVAWIRTMVPVWVGVGVAWLASRTGIVLDTETSAALGALAAGVAITVYYTLAQRLQAKWPWLGGFLLGSRKQPTYDRPSESPPGSTA